jgi:hypothetical protein
LSALQRAAMRRPFADLRDRIPVLKVMADEQWWMGIHSLRNSGEIHVQTSSLPRVDGKSNEYHLQNVQKFVVFV